MSPRFLMNAAPAMLDPVRGPERAILVLLCAVAGIFIFLITWASLAHIDVTASGEGSVVPSSHIQVVQNLEGGILRKVLVREGDRVAEGDVVAQIDNTGALSSYREDLSTYRALQATTTRLAAEASGEPLAFPAELADAPEGPGLIAAETALYESRTKGLADAVAVFQRQEEQARQTISEATERIGHLDDKRRSLAAEHGLVSRQVRDGLMSVVEKLKLERMLAETDEALSRARADIRASEIELSELASRIDERRSSFVSEAREELSRSSAELAALSQRLVAHRDRVGRREVRAPANGIVKRVATLTQGAVIEPGGTIMEIVPLDDTLFIEARMSPSDIAFIQPGQEAKVRITAYDFSVYGALPGRVERVGADTLVTQEGAHYFPVTVSVDHAALEDRQANLPIIAGMISEVSVITGDRTVLAYLLKPVLKLKDNAFRER
ncbi:HlyD family type I secretion periplasmic adaptor subunit [Parvibaculum sp.]|jgi:membrane fusion protein, adhesin transport system|uniref:HlyD family type I secretion periplasmic adaptor subunit n=1 Tax=Parvibaculum sp. TaxID=2024848 RepID=UPI000C3D443D|nr:HlyD family type I secretion periplasmic adaptor subunit [Parvibaculum sp.]MAM95652.1 hemolysin secretion protein D [Parvibaculum sp.]|tara:strand:- start:11754 stop:13073 length:1320 start_codon:yes stop_codon:yes gene_type:complete